MNETRIDDKNEVLSKIANSLRAIQQMLYSADDDAVEPGKMGDLMGLLADRLEAVRG